MKINAVQISHLLGLPKQSVDIYVFDEISSTNTFLKNLSKTKAPFTFCIAESQAQGRGRLNRTWVSPYGKNIYLSLRTTLAYAPHHISVLPLYVGLSVSQTLDSFIHPLTSMIKWPNDIYILHQKVAGILIESICLQPTQCELVIGIGINVNIKKQEMSLDNAWTSLYEMTQHTIDRNELIASLMFKLIHDLKIDLKQNPNDLTGLFSQKDELYGQAVTLRQGHELIKGVALGINDSGYLKIRDTHGQVLLISSGEASLSLS